ncbi:hypothetical protein CMO91_01385 [Candidatus Woesearchaeota archaeon]|jgi:hypothetical protein|nr:hypothetical protein [Candidatus Woesearchaeota archaeon]
MASKEHHPHIFVFLLVAVAGMGVLLLGMPSQKTSLIVTGDAFKDIDESSYAPGCPSEKAPVCGEDNITYRNSCYAYHAGVGYFIEGPCIDELR